MILNLRNLLTLTQKKNWILFPKELIIPDVFSIVHLPNYIILYLAYVYALTHLFKYLALWRMVAIY